MPGTGIDAGGMERLVKPASAIAQAGRRRRQALNTATS